MTLSSLATARLRGSLREQMQEASGRGPDRKTYLQSTAVPVNDGEVDKVPHCDLYLPIVLFPRRACRRHRGDVYTDARASTLTLRRSPTPAYCSGRGFQYIATETSNRPAPIHNLGTRSVPVCSRSSPPLFPTLSRPYPNERPGLTRQSQWWTRTKSGKEPQPRPVTQSEPGLPHSSLPKHNNLSND